MTVIKARQLRVGHVIVEGDPKTHQKFTAVKVVDPPCSKLKVHVNSEWCYDADAPVSVLGE